MELSASQKKVIVPILWGTAAGILCECLVTFPGLPLWLVLLDLPVGTFVAAGGVTGLLTGLVKRFSKPIRAAGMEDLPGLVGDHIYLVLKKMGYRRKVRADVEAELVAHFEDALRDCKTAEERDAKARQVIEGFGDAKLLGVLMRRAKKRCRPAWKKALIRSFQAAGILVAALIGYTVWFFLGEAVVTTDYVAQFNRLARPEAPAELNSWPAYRQAVEFYVEPPEEVGDFADWPGDMTVEQRTVVEEWLDENNDALAKFTEAAQKPYYWHEYESETSDMLDVPLPIEVSELRNMAKALCRRSTMSTWNGKMKAAVEDVLTCYRTGSHLRRSTTVVEQLIGRGLHSLATDTASVIVARSDFDAILLADFQRCFKRLCTGSRTGVDFSGEPLFYYDQIQRCFTAGPDGHIIPERLAAISSPQQRIFFTQVWKEIAEEFTWSERAARVGQVGGFLYELLTNPDKHKTRKQVKEVFDYYERICAMTPYEQKQAGINPDEDIASLVKGNLLFEVFSPQYARLCELVHVQRCSEDALLTTLGLLRYRQERGSYPQELSVLVEAGYIDKLPNDPYSAGPLVYKRVDGDFTLYSFGADFDDDGGLASKWGQGEEGGDQVFWPVGMED